jgi:hypothetical protein
MIQTFIQTQSECENSPTLGYGDGTEWRIADIPDMATLRQAQILRGIPQ